MVRRSGGKNLMSPHANWRVGLLPLSSSRNYLDPRGQPLTALWLKCFLLFAGSIFPFRIVKIDQSWMIVAVLYISFLLLVPSNRIAGQYGKNDRSGWLLSPDEGQKLPPPQGGIQ